jgi:sodium/proline symporter
MAIVIGMVGLGMTKAGVIPSLDGSNSETVIILISSTLAGHGLLPAFIGGIVLSGILASTMSTADSQLLAASSSVTNDILTNVFHIRFSDKKLMYIARASLFIIAFISIIIAWNPDSYVFKIVSFAWAGFGASFGPVTILALFWRRSNKEGALAGMITGGIIVFVWKYIVRPMGGYWDIYELLPAFIIAILVNVFVSLVTKAPDESVTNEFDQVENQLKRI